MTQRELDKIRDYTDRLLAADSPIHALSDAELGDLASLLEQRRQELSLLLEQWQQELSALLERRKQELTALLETASPQYHVPYNDR